MGSSVCGYFDWGLFRFVWIVFAAFVLWLVWVSYFGFAGSFVIGVWFWWTFGLRFPLSLICGGWLLSWGGLFACLYMLGLGFVFFVSGSRLDGLVILIVVFSLGFGWLVVVWVCVFVVFFLRVGFLG